MNRAGRVLIVGGIALAIWGMGYGLWYAVFAEHQALDTIGASLSDGFSAAAERRTASMEQSLAGYRDAKYVYDRQVDVHGHWIGLAMVLIVLGIGFDRVHLAERWKKTVAWALLMGAVTFPLGVLLETWSRRLLPQAVAVVGSALVIGGLAVVSVAVVRQRSAS